MHLDHQLPWNALARHITLSRSKRDSAFDLDLRVQRSPAQVKAYAHFVHVLSKTIADFARTFQDTGEDHVEAGQNGDLLSSDLVEYPEKFGLGPYMTNSLRSNPLCEEYRHIEYWIQRARSPQGEDGEEPSTYTTADADLADAVKMLLTIAARAGVDENAEDEESETMAREATRALLRLARHRDVPLMYLAGLHWGHGFGFDLAPLTALEIYLLINTIERTIINRKPPVVRTSAGEKVVLPKIGEEILTRTQAFERFIGNAMCDYDYPAQNVMHEAFWRELGWDRDEKSRTDPLVQVPGSLQPYLRACFRLLCVYHLMRTNAEPSVDMDAVWKEMVDGVFVWWGSAMIY
ncbi:hypothetical protein FFLO_06998 [Filobasidium floriforme]|uniref:Uncharacterized protein n=1 Tax=Filobasidium floriforme TaxID=5210 RepID=A0A8K0JG84_9TREE|nr:uncharacterized protein HD553DRAFT_311846 [Filobasidium floriforme]KAG7527370.1 hypothetical protein FFLO_06998 [Filobasidium floriforme]KAH8084852.1 hypothetical protein HD553DRAFT_311846 [Filobasidium floriforme]